MISAKKEIYVKKCLVCESDFDPSKWHPDQKYCSRRCCCRAQHRSSRNLSIKTLDLTCCVCDIKFTQKRANNTKYCSHSCKNLAISRINKGICVKGPRKHIKGSGYITSCGYKMISKKHPNSSKRGQILEHIFIMSEFLGRPLKKTESVHHKNGIRNDNRIENLELWCKTEGKHHRWGQRVEDKLNWCKEFLEQYGHAVIMKEELIK